MKYVLIALASAAIAASAAWYLANRSNNRYYVTTVTRMDVPFVFRIDKRTGAVHRMTTNGDACRISFEEAEAAASAAPSE